MRSVLFATLAGAVSGDDCKTTGWGDDWSSLDSETSENYCYLKTPEDAEPRWCSEFRVTTIVTPSNGGKKCPWNDNGGSRDAKEGEQVWEYRRCSPNAYKQKYCPIINDLNKKLKEAEEKLKKAEKEAAAEKKAAEEKKAADEKKKAADEKAAAAKAAAEKAAAKKAAAEKAAAAKAAAEKAAADKAAAEKAAAAKAKAAAEKAAQEKADAQKAKKDNCVKGQSGRPAIDPHRPAWKNRPAWKRAYTGRNNRVIYKGAVFEARYYTTHLPNHRNIAPSSHRGKPWKCLCIFGEEDDDLHRFCPQ